MTTLHDLWRPWIHRIGQPPSYFVWEWQLTTQKAEASLWVPAHAAEWVAEAVARTWPRATVQSCTDAPPVMTSETACTTLRLAEHYALGLATRTHEGGPLASLLEMTRWLRPEETATVQLIGVPASPDWSSGVDAALHSVRTEGRWPTRWQLTAGVIGRHVALTLASVVVHVQAVIEEILTSDPTPIASVQPIAPTRTLTRTTRYKSRYPGFDTTIRLAVTTPDEQHRTQLLQMLQGGYRAMDGDNRWIAHPVRTPRARQRWHRAWSTRRPPRWKGNPDYLSVPEVAPLVMLPTRTLQKDFQSAATRPTPTEELPDALLHEGMALGMQTFRQTERPIRLPVDPSHWDELCLPRVAIGAMGSGKTKGFGANFGIEALRQGFSVITFDPAKDEMGDEIATAAQRLGMADEKIVRLRFGETAYRLDWREAMHGKRAANRLAGEALNFFNLHGYDAGIETTRYLRLAGKTVGALGGSVKEMLDLFLEPAVRKDAIRRLESLRPDLVQQWQAYLNLSEGMRGKVTEPVLNRMDALLGDDVLAECLTSDRVLDFGQYLTGGYLVAVHLPDDLGREAKDILADFLLSKIELAMLARPEADQRPCFVIADEPHQYLSASARWKRMVVESRKWRVGLLWLFHSWRQIPPDLAEIIKAAGVNYHLYASNKHTYQQLLEEIEPITLEEAMATPRYHAINVLRAQGQTVPPFLARMLPPPTQRWPDPLTPHS